MTIKKERTFTELTYQQAYEKSLEISQKYPHLLPTELTLTPEGYWLFRLSDITQKGYKEISSYVVECLLNPIIGNFQTFFVKGS